MNQLIDESKSCCSLISLSVKKQLIYHKIDYVSHLTSADERLIVTVENSIKSNQISIKMHDKSRQKGVRVIGN